MATIINGLTLTDYINVSSVRDLTASTAESYCGTFEASATAVTFTFTGGAYAIGVGIYGGGLNGWFQVPPGGNIHSNIDVQYIGAHFAVVQY